MDYGLVLRHQHMLLLLSAYPVPQTAKAEARTTTIYRSPAYGPDVHHPGHPQCDGILRAHILAADICQACHGRNDRLHTRNTPRISSVGICR